MTTQQHGDRLMIPAKAGIQPHAKRQEKLGPRLGSICLEKQQTLYRGRSLHVNLARSRGL
jgi:hypothetical protein